MWLNNRHINQSPPPGVFGGAMCTCERCSKARNKPELSALEILQEANGIKDKEEADESSQR